MAEENSNKRIARNTILLYTRSLINLVIGLYTSRLTLDALGIPDYGIYNVVGSLVALFGLFNGSLNTAISRFITYELGRNNNRHDRAGDCAYDADGHAGDETHQENQCKRVGKKVSCVC